MAVWNGIDIFIAAIFMLAIILMVGTSGLLTIGGTDTNTMLISVIGIFGFFVGVPVAIWYSRRSNK